MAPTSSISSGRSRPGAGISTASAGRWTERIRFSANSAAVIVAPVEPGLASASERPAATSAAARTIDVSGRERTARTGSSSLPITSLVSMTSTFSAARPANAAAGPKTRTAIPSPAAMRTPSATTSIPASAPRASKATVTGRPRRSGDGAAGSPTYCSSGRPLSSGSSATMTSRPA